MGISRLTFATMFSLLSIFTIGLVSARVAGAYATLEGPPVYSSAPGLPDGRVYEQVSPADKNGNEAGASSLYFTGNPPGNERYGLASAEGDSVLFEGTGPMGETPTPSLLYFVATRTSSGWKTRSVLPRPQQSGLSPLNSFPEELFMSQDLSHAVLTADTYTLAPDVPDEDCNQIYLTGADPFVPATWISSPEIESPITNCDNLSKSKEAANSNGMPIGGSPDLSTIYFSYPGTLLPEDASRASHVHSGRGFESEAWGLYEYRQGILHEAGVLPDRSLDPFGAVPAVSGHGRSFTGNQVSEDGSRVFFVSPDPASCEPEGGHNDCALDPPELYVRESGERTLLVSRDISLPEAGGSPAAAPDGVSKMLHPAVYGDSGKSGTYVFASPDGSQAFFQSEDQLTPGAPEGPPANTSLKTYDFDVENGSLTYLPDVGGLILGSTSNGSSLVFSRPAGGGSPAELDLWSAGPGGGSVSEITQLPAGDDVEPVRMTNDGSVVLFTTSELPGFKDGSGEGSQIFRYDVGADTLGCVSCAPAGVASSAATMSPAREENGKEGDEGPGMVDERGMSANGDRVFFQTAAPLVPQDTNTGTTVPALEHEGVRPQGQDVYEWENGVVYLISSGKSSRDSYFLDNSESGNDVFFATTEGLVAGDLDGGYDVYDARVPRPGDNPPPAAVPCEGSICEGPPRVQVPLGEPASATFSGLGNIPPEAVASPVTKSKAKSKLVCKKGYVRKKNKCVRSGKAKKSSKGRK